MTLECSTALVTLTPAPAPYPEQRMQAKNAAIQEKAMNCFDDGVLRQKVSVKVPAGPGFLSVLHDISLAFYQRLTNSLLLIKSGPHVQMNNVKYVRALEHTSLNWCQAGVSAMRSLLLPDSCMPRPLHSGRLSSEELDKEA